MGKSSILKKIHNAAKNYQRYLAGKTFMYVYEGKSIEVVLHLTGVNTKLKAKEFYKHAKTKNGLEVQEFFFDKDHPYDLAEKKTDHLLVMILYKVRGSKEMNQNTLRGR